MEVQKCLEYYFEKDTPLEDILEYVEKNIEELKKISKIKKTNIDIVPNEYGIKTARLTLIVKEKRKKIKKQKQLVIKEEKTKQVKVPKVKNKVFKENILKIKELNNKLFETKIEKQKEKQILKEIIPKANPIVKIEMDIPKRKYGAYKDGGTFVPYKSK